jgi:hypothetical protein
MIVKKQMECRLAGETEVLGEKTCSSATFVDHKIPHDQTRVLTQAAAVGSRRLFFYYYYLVCEAIGTAAIPGLLCQPRVIVKMIVENQMECRLAGEVEVL